MRICSPHCGIAPESGSGGEVYERELLKDLAGLGVECHIPLARGEPHDQDASGWTVHPVWPPKGLRWYVAPFAWPRAIKRVWDAQPFDLLRAHSVRFIGPAALLARRRYRLPVPVVDASPPSGSEPAESVHREAGARRLRPGDHRQRVRAPSARRRARAPHRSRDRGLLRRRTEVRPDAEGSGAPRALWARGPSGSSLPGTAYPPQEPVLPRRGLRRDPPRRARTGGARLGRRRPAPRRADRARAKAWPRGRRDLHGLRARGREGSDPQSGRRLRLSVAARRLPAGAAGGDVLWQAGRRLPRGVTGRDGRRRAVGIPRGQERPERIRRTRARPAARPRAPRAFRRGLGRAGGPELPLGHDRASRAQGVSRGPRWVPRAAAGPLPRLRQGGGTSRRRAGVPGVRATIRRRGRRLGPAAGGARGGEGPRGSGPHRGGASDLAPPLHAQAVLARVDATRTGCRPSSTGIHGAFSRSAAGSAMRAPWPRRRRARRTSWPRTCRRGTCATTPSGPARSSGRPPTCTRQRMPRRSPSRTGSSMRSTRRSCCTACRARLARCARSRRVLAPGGRYLGIERASPWAAAWRAREARAMRARAIEQNVGERPIRYREWEAILRSCGFDSTSLSPVAGHRVRAPWLRRLGNAARPIYVAIRLTR